MMNIELRSDGYLLKDYNTLQYEPYIPFRVEKNGVTDYYASAVQHIESLEKEAKEYIENIPQNPLDVVKEELRLEFAQSNAELFETILALQGGTENV